MNHCVPDCDEFPTAKSGAAAQELAAAAKNNSKFSENDFSELIWTGDGSLGVMQVAGSRNSQWGFWGNSRHSNDDRLAPSKPASDDRIKDGTLDAVVISAVGTETVATAATAAAYEEDELISWLQYPDDNLDKNNCSDIFATPALHDQSSCVTQPGPRDSQQQASSGEPAAARTVATAPAGASQWADPARKPRRLGAAASMLPPKAHKVNSSLNFSHFSRPAVIAKASLHTLGKCSTSITNHLETEFKKNDAAVVVAPPAAPSGGAVEGSIGSIGTQRSGVAHPPQEQSSEVQQSLSQSSLPSLISCTSRKEAAGTRGKDPSSSATAAAPAVTVDTNDQTLTSSSGGSGHSAEEMKRKNAKGKRKMKTVEDSPDCQSEDVEGESVDVKKKAAPARASKRSRAAEVHNLSERRRRDRINEKMKALQELIPNSNKTDKASMLDEAIEYLKMLQLQLQMMAMRTGFTLPPMIIPAGMQHLQMPQLPALGMGMGVGMGLMGMGMGLVDPAGRPIIPLPGQGSSAATVPVNMTMDMYHACILQQQMQLQLRQQIQQQQQQQTQQQTQQQQQQQQKTGGIAMQ